MRFLKILFVITTLVLLSVPSLSLAEVKEQGGDDGQGHESYESHEGFDGHHMEMMEDGQGEPWEECWYENPWDFWRHMNDGFSAQAPDLGSLDLDAIHVMGNVRRIAILPFMDRTTPTGQGESRMEQIGGPRRMVENLAAALMSRGYLVVPPMDVEALYYAYLAGDAVFEAPEEEVANNSMFFDSLPDRALDFYLEVVPGLQDQYDGGQDDYWLTREDIQGLAGLLEADVIIRGFVNEFAITTDIDADLRTIIPPFLGLINPDKRATIEVAYYLYEGESGEMIWNGSFETRDDSNWPLFESTSELLWSTEDNAVSEMTDHILPSWCALLMSHPEWIPFEMWHEWCLSDGCGYEDCHGQDCGHSYHHQGRVNRPDWVNPMRQGWHDQYYRHEIRFNRDPVDHPPDFTWFHDVGGYYYGYR